MAGRRVLLVVVGALCSLPVASPLPAQTTNLAAGADTYLRSGSPNQNQGADTRLRIQSSGGNRVLVAFDPAAIATAVDDGSLAAASLELYIEDNGDKLGCLRPHRRRPPGDRRVD